MKTFKEENRISLNENQEEEDNEEAEPFLVGDETHKQMPYTQEATTRTHHKKLTRYIRLVDYMLMDAKLQMIHQSTNQVEFALQQDYSTGMKYQISESSMQSMPLFEVKVLFMQREIFFDPACKVVKDTMENVINESIKAVCKNEPLLS